MYICLFFVFFYFFLFFFDFYGYIYRPYSVATAFLTR